MLISVKKIWQYFCRFLQARKIWNWPRESEVVIYDAANSKILLEYLKPWSPEILHVRNKKIYIRVLLKSFFREGSRVDAYVDCFLEKVNPRLVVTVIDNNPTFYKISKRHPDIKTIFFQNGLRTYYCDVFEFLDSLDSNTLNAYFVDHMFVFGSAIGELYSKYIKGNILPLGSIKNNFVQKEVSSEPGVIALISHWIPGVGMPGSLMKIKNTHIPYDVIWRHPDDIVIQCLMQYTQEKNKRLVIVPRLKGTNTFNQEKEYYRKLMGREPEFLLPSTPYPGYSAVDSAEIVIALDSTLGYESIGRGNKTAIFTFRGTITDISGFEYGWPANFPDEGPFWTNQAEPQTFIRILDYLFEVSGEQWKKDVESTNFSSLMEYDPGNTIFQSILEKELGSPPK